MEKLDAENFGAQLDAMFGGNSPRAAVAPRPAQPAAPQPPAVPAPARAETPPAPVKPKPKVYTVIVVDDNKDYRDLVKHLLSVHHFNVLEAVNGEEALQMINASVPDLALVDFNMPKMNGYELIQEVRSNYELKNMRIIMFTGAANRQHLKTLNMNISDFLDKPVPNAKLLESVNKALGIGQKPAAPPRRPQAPAAEAVEPPPPGETGLQIERFGLPEEGEEPEAPHFEPPPKPVSVELPPEAISRPEPALAPVELPELPEAPEPAPPAPEPEPEAAPEPVEPEEVVPEMNEVFTQEDAQELELIDADAEKKQEAKEVMGIEALEKDSPLIQMVNKILVRAVEMRASDIHMEPQEDRVSVRVRVDGVLRQLTTLPIAIHPRVTARIKIMSSLVITERRIPQDGQFRVNIKGNKIEFRVSTLPCIKGEKIVMRVLGQSKLNSDLSSLALTEREHRCLEAALKSPNGLILVTGPTGSGKTTTLYTMINVLNKPDVNIMTAEDPVEYEVPHVNQVKIIPAVGLTFESTLRAFLRQDPDIMLVGEIRDLETAEISIKASITGHLVFSTLHTNSAPATVVRLTHMGVAPFLVAASVKMVIAQRLVRTLCPHCKRPSRLSEEDARFLSDSEKEMLKKVWHAPGCHHCGQSGYSGRKALFEVMPVETSAMRQLITSNFNVDMLTELAKKEGMTTLRQSALTAVANGSTSMAEALKIMMG
ncbi:MAG: ATPase, T2SS/T4P/T4SS family [Elusimicrobiales bacterium]